MFAVTLGPAQIIILVLLGILLFGNRFPDVGRSLAKALREFQKAWHGIEDEMSGSLAPPDLGQLRATPRVTAAVLKLPAGTDSTASA
jgi:TatA/E family protein of Tat protein translocase